MFFEVYSASSFAQLGSPHFEPKLCECDKRLLLFKATTTKNNGRFFWRKIIAF